MAGRAKVTERRFDPPGPGSWELDPGLLLRER